jgi:hypothetical protein
MTVEQLERGERLIKDIREYEKRLQCAENGDIIVIYNDTRIHLTEDIYQEMIVKQIKNDLDFLKERFEKL